MSEWNLASKTHYVVRFKNAPWIVGGEVQYDRIALDDAQTMIADMKDKYPQIEARLLKAVTVYYALMEI